MAGNKFHGYVQLPGKPEQTGDIWVTFNAQITANRESVRHEGFSLRMTAEWPRVSEGPPEIGIRLTIEQWLDLIAEMRQELKKSEEFRKELDNWASPNIVVYISRTAEFARAARQAYERMVDVRKQIPDLKEMPSPESDLEAARSFVQRKIDLEEQADREAFVVLAFATFALESLVNAWAVRDLPPRYSEFLDKLSLPAKWIIVPRLAADVEIQVAGQIFEKLRILGRDRNEIAHPKTKKLQLESEQLSEWAGKVRDPLNAADNAIAALNGITEFVRDSLGPTAAGLLLGKAPELGG
jgi:hypothetical protein